MMCFGVQLYFFINCTSRRFSAFVLHRHWSISSKFTPFWSTARHSQNLRLLPGLVSAQNAAARIVKGMRRGQSEISFPRTLRLGLAVLAMLPWRLRARLNQPLRFRVRPPAQSDHV